jgi:hypothetical protein
VHRIAIPPFDTGNDDVEQLESPDTVWLMTGQGVERGNARHYDGQPHPVIYRSVSNLRHRLGRCDDAPWYRYTFSDSGFAVEAPAPGSSNFDPRHRP